MKKNVDSIGQKGRKWYQGTYLFHLLYYRKDHENEEFEQRAQNFEPSICYVGEQEVAT
jgi:hypothetical protein